jgi:16S rRNA U516 pseudouridylate synthase RsuA-like enzyme
MDMAKPKRKLTAAERRAKKERKKNFMTIFVNGKQKRVRRPATIEGLPVDEFIRRNADPIWLHQNGMWEYIPVEEPINETLGFDPLPPTEDPPF